MQSWPLLSILLWLPIIGGLLVLFISKERDASRVRFLSLLITLITLAVAGFVTYHFDQTTADLQFVERTPWISVFNIEYYLGVDGISWPLIVLTCITSLFVVIAGWQVIQDRVSQYYAAFLIMQGLMTGVFMAMDAILFYVFWEAMLVPMFLVIGIWGGTNRVYATIKFFLYTFLGSVFMFVSFLYLYTQAGSFAIHDFYGLPLSTLAGILIFIGFFLAFAVKIPMWPVHTWLPDAHVQAPTGGSVVLAAVMLKMGGYGFIRFSLPVVTEASQLLAPIVIALSLIAVVYIGFVAIVQKDLKKLIAYSSIAHMGFVTLGLFLVFAIAQNANTVEEAVNFATLGVQGALFQMLSHGFISAGLFLCVGVLYDRMHTHEISAFGGIANTMPMFAALAMLFAMANTGLPGTSGFVGELLVIMAAFKVNIWIAVLAASTLVLSAAYTLWMYRRVVYGEVANECVAALQDVNGRERFMLVALAGLVILFGVWPDPILQLMDTSILQLMANILPAPGS